MNAPNDLPSVGTEDALRFATLNEQCANAWKESSEAHKFRMDTGRTIRALAAERDELASRVRELEQKSRRRFALLDSIHSSLEVGVLTSEDSTAETFQDMIALEMNGTLASKEHP